MTVFTFSGLSLKLSDGSPAPFATVPIYAKSDTAFATPLAALDMSGTTTLPGGVTADGNGDVPDFKVDVPDDMPRVVAHAAGYQDREILSVDELIRVASEALAAAIAAQAAATQSASEAEASRVAAETAAAGGTGGTGGGTSDAVMAAHVAAADPHPQYLNLARALAKFYDQTTTDTRINNAVVGERSANRNRANHTGTQPMSSVDGLVAALSELGGTAVNSVNGETGAITITIDSLTNVQSFMKVFLGAASAAAARSAIGAGTSSLVIGNTATTALRGDAIVRNPSSIAGLADGTVILRYATS